MVTSPRIKNEFKQVTFSIACDLFLHLKQRYRCLVPGMQEPEAIK